MIDEPIRIRRAVLAAIEAHARSAAPRECCGLLVAREGRIDEALAVENHAAEPDRRYDIDPRDYLATIRRLRGTGASVVGAYHSHPRSAPEPSETDRAMAFGEFIYLIAGPVDGSAPFAVRACCLESGNFHPLRLVPEPEEPQT